MNKLYASLTDRQKRVCDQLFYLTVLEMVSHIQKSCNVIADKVACFSIKKAAFDLYRRCAKEKYRTFVPEKTKEYPAKSIMIRYLVPPHVLHEKYGLWKSYLDDLLWNVGSKIYHKDFCAHVDHSCDDACREIEGELNKKEIEFLKGQGGVSKKGAE